MSNLMTAPKRMTALEHGVEAGIRWAICRAPCWGAINGYALLPEGHQWRALDLQSSDEGPSVSGGITYGPNEDGWVGFDTLRAGDLWPGGGGSHFCPPSDCHCTIWTQEMVAGETKRLARQIAAADPTLATAVSA